MKKSSLILLSFFFILNAYNQDVSTRNMILSANQDLLSWLAKIPSGFERYYGFHNRNEFPQAEIGIPVQVYTLTEEFFTRPNPVGYLKPSEEWRIPVLYDQQYCALVTVIKQNGEWKIVDLGASVLAREIGNYRQHVSVDSKDMLKILRIYQTQSDFLFSGDPNDSPDKIMLFPLSSAYFNLPGLDTKTHDELTLSELVVMIRTALSLNTIDQ